MDSIYPWKTEAYWNGRTAYLSADMNPYTPGSSNWTDFEVGFQEELDAEHGV